MAMLALGPGAAAQAGEAGPEAQLPASLAQPTIVGGRELREGEWRREFRWQVGLVYAGQPKGVFCGGTLVHRLWVLTASHCVDGLRPRHIEIRTNARSRDEPADIIAVERIVMHSDYNRNTFDSDIALIRLATPSDLPTVGVASIRDTIRHAPYRSRARILGWGAITEGGRSSRILKIAPIPIERKSYCRRAYDGLTSITSNMICAGPRSGGRDACQGDSGGPLVVRDDLGHWLQVGVTSFGFGCAQAGYPGVYAKVGSFKAWIMGTIRDGG
ncbi:MAG: serine protease [Roseovarius sp.]